MSLENSKSVSKFKPDIQIEEQFSESMSDSEGDSIEEAEKILDSIGNSVMKNS